MALGEFKQLKTWAVVSLLRIKPHQKFGECLLLRSPQALLIGCCHKDEIGAAITSLVKTALGLSFQEKPAFYCFAMNVGSTSLLHGHIEGTYP